MNLRSRFSALLAWLGILAGLLAIQVVGARLSAQAPTVEDATVSGTISVTLPNLEKPYLQFGSEQLNEKYRWGPARLFIAGVEIDPISGSVKLPADKDIDAAAKDFWRAVAATYPGVREEIVLAWAQERALRQKH